MREYGLGQPLASNVHDGGLPLDALDLACDHGPSRRLASGAGHLEHIFSSHLFPPRSSTRGWALPPVLTRAAPTTAGCVGEKNCCWHCARGHAGSLGLEDLVLAWRSHRLRRFSRHWGPCPIGMRWEVGREAAPDIERDAGDPELFLRV